jgi:hypothetical protein
MDRLSNCTLFTMFDVRWGYNNIRIKEGDEWKAAFLTQEGLFEPTVMFFRPHQFPRDIPSHDEHNIPIRKLPKDGYRSTWMTSLSTQNQKTGRRKKNTWHGTGVTSISFWNDWRKTTCTSNRHQMLIRAAANCLPRRGRWTWKT